VTNQNAAQLIPIPAEAAGLLPDPIRIGVRLFYRRCQLGRDVTTRWPLTSTPHSMTAAS
jgi:hypothetical protein